MTSRVAAGVLAGVLAIGLAGCSAADPKPSPSPTPPFASADAAYKAAEATYKGYVNALNKVDLNEPKTFEPVYAWLLGDALGEEKKELTAMSSRGWVVDGRTVVTLLEPISGGQPRWGDVSMASCLDVRDVSLADASGQSVVAADRPDFPATKIALVRDRGTPTGMKITKITKRTVDRPCHG